MAHDTFAADVANQGEDSAVRSILAEVCEATHMGFAAVARVTDCRWIAAQVLDRIEFGLKPGDELELKTTICDEIRQSGEAVIIDHVAADLTWRTHYTPMLYGFESYISLPLYLEDGSFYGTLCAIDPEPRALSAPALVERMRGYADAVSAILSHGKVATG